MKVGIALKPKTPAASLKPYLGLIDLALVMTGVTATTSSPMMESHCSNTAKKEIARRNIGVHRKKDELWLLWYRRAMRTACYVIFKFCGCQFGRCLTKSSSF